MRNIIGIILLCFLLIGCTENENVNVKGENQAAIIESEVEDLDDVVTVDNGSDSKSVEVIRKAKVLVDILNVRKSSTIDSEILGKVYLNNIYEIIDEKENDDQLWYKISVNNHVGWIASWFCEITDEEPYDRNPYLDNVEIDIDNYYYHNKIVDFDELIEWKEKIIAYETLNNSEIVSGMYTFKESGKLSVILEDSLGRSREFFQQIEVVEYYKYTKALFTEMNINSKIIGFEDLTDLEYDNDSEAYVTLEDGKMEIWYKLMYDGKTCYAYCSDEEVRNLYVQIKRYHFILNNGELYTVEGAGYTDNILAANGIMGFEHNYDYFMINYFTGETIYADSMSYFPNNEHIIVFMNYSEEESENSVGVNQVRIYKRINKGLDLIYNFESEKLLLHRLNFISDNGVEFTANYEIENEWRSTNPYGYKEKYRLNINGDEVINSRISGDVALVNNVDNDEIITVYSKLDESSNIIGRFKRSDIELLTFNRTLDKIDDKLCDWFDVNLKDGQLGYAYRPRTELDGTEIYLDEPMYIKLNNGELYTMMVDGLLAYGDIDDCLLFNDVIVHYIYYDGVGSFLISLENGEDIDAPFYGLIDVSPNKSYAVGAGGDSEAGWSWLNLVHIVDNNYNRKLELATDKGYIRSGEWLSDTEYKFIVNIYEFGETFGILKLENGQWSIQLDEKYEIEVNYYEDV